MRNPPWKRIERRIAALSGSRPYVVALVVMTLISSCNNMQQKYGHHRQVRSLPAW
jgi:hypothetical protein